MNNDELLRESVSRLEQALAAERSRRDEAEATLAGLRCITDAGDLAATDAALLEGLQPLLRYQAAAILLRSREDGEVFAATSAGHSALLTLRWRSGPLLERVLGGQTVALFDLRRTPELAALAETSDIRSALCVPLSTSTRAALLLGVHDQPAFFTQRQVALAQGFAQTATRVLENLGAREHRHRRQIAEEQAAALARTNAALREQVATIGAQLDTIHAQQAQIQRLRAPVLQVGPQTLVVPVVGELDQEALVEITETLLHAISERRARRVILDLTGFESADAAIADRLRSLARAIALLGARCVLTGLRPALALTLSDSALEVMAFATLADAVAAIRD